MSPLILAALTAVMDVIDHLAARAADNGQLDAAYVAKQAEARKALVALAQSLDRPAGS